MKDSISTVSDVIIICDKNNNKLIEYDKSTNTVTICTNEDANIVFENGISLFVDGNFNISCSGEINLNANDKISIDSNLPEDTPSLFLNSKMCSQIRDNEESIEYRNKAAYKLKELDEHKDEIQHPHFSIDEQWELKKFIEEYMSYKFDDVEDE